MLFQLRDTSLLAIKYAPKYAPLALGVPKTEGVRGQKMGHSGR